MVDKTSQIKIQLALSQLLLLGSKSAPFTQLKVIMPFLSLNKSRLRMVSIKFPQVDGLEAAIWSQAGGAHVTNHKNTTINQSYNYHTNSEYLSFNGNRLKDDDQKKSDEKSIVKELESEVEIINRTERLSSSRGLTNEECKTQRLTKQAQVSAQVDSVNLTKVVHFKEKPVLQRAMAYRPFFLDGNSINQSAPIKTTPGIPKPELDMSTLGLLSLKSNPLSNNEVYNESFLTPGSNPLVTDTIFGVESGFFPVEKNVFSDSDSNNDLGVSESVALNDSNKLGNSKTLKINNEEPSVTLPEKKQSKSSLESHFATELENSQPLPQTLSRKVEKMVEEKLSSMLKPGNNENLIMEKVTNELKNSLAPTRTVSDEFIRVVVKKLNKEIQENRFRMGLLS